MNDLRERVEVLAKKWESSDPLNWANPVDAPKQLRALLAPREEPVKLTMHEAVEAARGIRERAEMKRREVAETEAMSTREEEPGLREAARALMEACYDAELHSTGIKSELIDAVNAALAERCGEALEFAETATERTQAWMRKNGIIFDSVTDTPEDRWQKIAFSIYTDLVEVAEKARAALRGTGEEKP